MTRPRRAALAGLLALAAAVGTALGPASAQDGLASAEARATALRAELAVLRDQAAQTVAAYEQAEHALAEAVTRAMGLSVELDAARRDAVAATAERNARIAALYKSGGRTGLLMGFTQATSARDLATRYADMTSIVDADTEARDASTEATLALAAAEEAAGELAAERTRLAGRLAEETDRLDASFAAQQQALASADAEVRRLVEEQREAARRAAAAALAAASASAAGGVPGPGGPAFSRPGGTCPVGPVHNFTNDWHAPRSGGRQHQGTDVFAPKGSNAFAVVDGVVDKVGAGGLGGLSLWLRGDDGTRYYYAHNDRNLVTVGQRVTAGQPVATVGNTGNAETTPAHVHFEVHPGGGAAVNPYPWLSAICAG